MGKEGTTSNDRGGGSRTGSARAGHGADGRGGGSRTGSARAGHGADSRGGGSRTGSARAGSESFSKVPEHYHEALSAAGVSAEEAKRYYGTFMLFDVDGSGSINAAELYSCLQVAGQAPESQEDIERMLSESDTDASGVLEFVEFASLMSRLCKPDTDVRQQLVRSFSVFDKDHSGFLDRDELRNAIYGMGAVDLTEAEFDELANAVDTNGDGRIDYEEFASILLTDINQLIQSTREEMQQKGRPEHPDHPEHPEHPDHPDHPEHPEHPDHPDHPEHPEHPDHPDHPEHPEHPDHPDHPEHPEHPEHPDHPERESSHESKMEGGAAAVIKVTASGGAAGADGEAPNEEPPGEGGQIQAQPAEEGQTEESPTEEEPLEEPSTEEEKVKEPPAEEQEEPPAEEEQQEEPAAEEEQQEEPPAEEEQQEEPPAEEEQQEEPPAEEEQQEEPPADEEQQEEPPADEEQQEEPQAERKEEPTTEALKEPQDEKAPTEHPALLPAGQPGVVAQSGHVSYSTVAAPGTEQQEANKTEGEPKTQRNAATVVATGTAGDDRKSIKRSQAQTQQQQSEPLVSQSGHYQSKKSSGGHSRKSSGRSSRGSKKSESRPKSRSESGSSSD